eukprot:1740701-Amphidinium_carterae.1
MLGNAEMVGCSANIDVLLLETDEESGKCITVGQPLDALRPSNLTFCAEVKSRWLSWHDAWGNGAEHSTNPAEHNTHDQGSPRQLLVPYFYNSASPLVFCTCVALRRFAAAPCRAPQGSLCPGC